MRTRIAISAHLNGKTASWQGHTYGFSLDLIWTTIGSDWSAKTIDRKVIAYAVRHTTSDKVAGSITQEFRKSREIVYLRGGGKYQFITSREDGSAGSEPVLHKEGFSWEQGQSKGTFPVLDDITLPVTDADRLQEGIDASKKATDDLKTYTDGAFKDGVISEAEAKAIATYTHTANEAWQSAFGEYEKVYTNTYLTGVPKTTLLNTKTTLAGAKEALIKAINDTIKDGKATVAERDNVNAKYTAFSDALQAFSTALETAREAIRKAGEEATRKHADDKARAEQEARQAAIDNINKQVSSASTTIKTLEEVQKKLNAGLLTKADTESIQYLLNALKSTTAGVAGGLLLTNEILLSDPTDEEGKVSATISGARVEGAKALRLGIKYDEEGVPTGDEMTALANDGTGHFGSLHFDGERLTIREDDNDFMSFGGEVESESQMLNTNVERETLKIAGISGNNTGERRISNNIVYVTNSSVSYKATISVTAEAIAVNAGGGREGNPNRGGPDNPEWTIDDNIFHATTCTTTAHLRVVRVRGVTAKAYTSREVTVEAHAPGGSWRDGAPIPPTALRDYKSKEQAVQIYIPQGDIRAGDWLYLELVINIQRRGNFAGAENTYAIGYASVGTILFDRSRSKDRPFVHIGEASTAYFYDPSKYLLINPVDYSNLILLAVGNALFRGDLEVRGTLKANGLLLAGNIDTSGRVSVTVGANSNRIVYTSRSGGYITVYHYLGHSNYSIQLTNGGNNRDNPVYTSLQANSFTYHCIYSSGDPNDYSVNPVSFALFGYYQG